MHASCAAFAPTRADAALLEASPPPAQTEQREDPAVPRAHLTPAAPGANGLEDGRREGLRDLLLVLLLVLMVAAAQQIGERAWVQPRSPLGYWIGVAGATMMLLLFLYPLRKYAGWMRRAGRVKSWFWFHLVMGVAGPWLILVHAGFRTGSLNAAVALYSMGVVVASGVLGRFLYVRLNGSLPEAERALQRLRKRAGFVELPENEPSPLNYAPAVEQRLRRFDTRQTGGAGEKSPAGRTDAQGTTGTAGTTPGVLRALRQVLLLPLEHRHARRRCRRDLRAPLAARADAGRWTRDEWRRRSRRAERLIDDLLAAVVRVARQRAFGRLFALWHMAHLPFIFLLVISAVVHVVAVHAY